MKDYPVIPITASFITGIILASFNLIGNGVIFISAILFAAVAYLIYTAYSRKKYYNFIVAVLSAVALVAGIYLHNNQSKIESLNIYKEKGAYAKGSIRSIDLIRDKVISLKLNCDSLIFSDSTLRSNLLLNVQIMDPDQKKLDSLYSNILPGYAISISGTFSSGKEKRNPGEFDYAEYLTRNKISGSITAFTTSEIKIRSRNADSFRSFVFEMRKGIDEIIREYHSKETAGLLRGFILADRNEITPDTKNDFINSGVIHILAVSGSNVGYIVIIFLIIFQRVNIRFRLLLTIAGIILFFLITDFPTSVFRASLMSIAVIVAHLTGRSTNIFNSLALSALVILVMDCSQLFDPGFQLSFSAVLSIAVFVPVLNEIAKSTRIRNSILKSLVLVIVVSLSAQIGTLPFSLYYFGKYSLVGILANIIIIPLSGLIIAIGILTLFLSAFSSYIAFLSAYTNDLLSYLLFESIHFTGNLQYAFVSVNGFSKIDVIIFYLFTLLVLFFYKRFSHFYTKTLLITLAVINIFIFTSLDNEEFFRSNQLNILMVDVGQGDAILIKFPNGETALVDAGNATFYFDAGERIILPLLEHLGIDQIDYGFISHLDSDHYGGFVSLIHYKKIKKIIKPQTDSSSTKDRKFESYLVKNNIPFEFYNTEQNAIGNTRLYSLTGDVINKSKLSHNNKSGVLKLVYGQSEILFTGDIEKQAEQIYTASYQTFLQSDILKVAHHGSKTSSTEKFLCLVDPDISLISAGIQNKFKHPAQEIITRIKNYGSQILRTDQSGALFLVSDGNKFSLVDWNSK